jgi:hypothetical protein
VERELILHVPGVERRSGLKEHDPAFFFGNRTMLDSAWHDDKFPFFDPLVMISVIHAQAAFDYEEELVFVLVMVKHEFAVELHELYMLAVELGRNTRMLEVCNLGELFGDIDFGHDYASEVDNIRFQGFKVSRFQGFKVSTTFPTPFRVPDLIKVL